MASMKLILAALIAAVITTSAQGQTFEQVKACAVDAFRYCIKDAESLDMSAIKACLAANRLKISHKCREMLRTHGNTS